MTTRPNIGDNIGYHDGDNVINGYVQAVFDSNGTTYVGILTRASNVILKTLDECIAAPTPEPIVDDNCDDIIRKGDIVAFIDEHYKVTNLTNKTFALVFDVDDNMADDDECEDMCVKIVSSLNKDDLTKCFEVSHVHCRKATSNELKAIIENLIATFSDAHAIIDSLKYDIKNAIKALAAID